MRCAGTMFTDLPRIARWIASDHSRVYVEALEFGQRIYNRVYVFRMTKPTILEV